MILALVSSKGGAGKSTLAAALAGHWHAAGKRVAVVDADPQGTLSSCWPSPGWTVEQVDARRLVDTVRRLAAANDVLLIDTPGFGSSAAIDALALADVAIVPARPSLPDLTAAARVLEQVAELNRARGKRPARALLVFCQVPAQGLVAAHIQHEAARLKLPVAPVAVGMRAMFAESALRGSTPSELEPNGKAAGEVAALAKFIERKH